MDLEELAKISVDCGFRLHKELGPGLLESVYEVLLGESLKERGIAVRRQVLRLMNFPLGLLMNFGQETFKQGIKRVANNHAELSS